MNTEFRPRILQVETPEGVSIGLELGSASDRAVAFLIDSTLLMAVILLFGYVTISLGNYLLVAFFLSFTFVLRIFYFVVCEAGVRAATLGKRAMKLRVVRADGGPLSIDAVLTRNFTRELEIFLPLMFLASPQMFWAGHSGWVRLGASFWFLAIASMPMWSRSRLRLGDLVGGTRVVRTPKPTLLSDMAGQRPAEGDAPSATLLVNFTPAQLDIYGIYELQVLEDVLRKRRQPGGTAAVTAVAKRIRTKIGWNAATQGSIDDQQFLERFYAAQRKHLEQQLLFGKRKDRKRS